MDLREILEDSTRQREATWTAENKSGGREKKGEAENIGESFVERTWPLKYQAWGRA